MRNYVNNHWRLHYWFKGVPLERPKGPWWNKDFETYEDMTDYLESLRPCLHRFVIVHLPLPHSVEPVELAPPKDLSIIDAQTGNICD